MARVAKKKMSESEQLDGLVEAPAVTNPTLLLPKAWQNFLGRFSEIETVPLSQWRELHLLAYLCKRFENHFGKKFALSMRGAPSKCTEIFMVKKTMAMLNSVNPSIVKQYIDWVFDKKVIPNRLNFRSVGFLMSADMVNQFQCFLAKTTKIAKTTELPQEWLAIANQLDLPVATYGDLAFAKMALDQAPESEARAPYRTLFSNLIRLGFEPNILTTLV